MKIAKLLKKPEKSLIDCNLEFKLVKIFGMVLQESPLGKSTVYHETYSPDLLFPISRKLARDKLGLTHLPFGGYDVWNAYELSWLNPKGKPEIAWGKLFFPCTTPNIIESKSLKLYLNSFNHSHFSSKEEIQKIMENDLSQAVQCPVTVFISEKQPSISEITGICIDYLDIETNIYHVNPQLLVTQDQDVEEKLYSHLLKSNCLATGQPDWGTVYIHYSGPKIQKEGLLKYIISHRHHSAFAEYSVEQVYLDILQQCQPKHLTVCAYFTRRGGIEINPFRSNFETDLRDQRQWRQ